MFIFMIMPTIGRNCVKIREKRRKISKFPIQHVVVVLVRRDEHHPCSDEAVR